MDNGDRSTRNELFQELKPRCVELSQLALRDDGSASNNKAMIESITPLLNVLEQRCQRIDGVFDEKLADYVFFPISQILRRKQKYTDRLSELTIKCLKILLEYGWRKGVSLEMGKQFLILLTFVAGGVPGKESTRAPEELMGEAYGALAALFRDLSVTPGGSATLIESGTLPALGHCITVILDGITDGPQPATQIQALRALDSVWHCLKDPQALSTFLPGTISALTKCLVPTTGSRRSGTTLVRALEVLGSVLVSLLSDVQTRNIRREEISSTTVIATTSSQSTLTKSWLKATAGQIKLALSNVVKLRSHKSVEVRKALNRFCLKILDECHDSLPESASMLVETCMTLSGIDAEDSLSGRSTSLVDLASIHPDLSESIKNTVYNWVTSLPRVMQSNDEAAKSSALAQLSKAHKLLVGLNVESNILEDTLGISLRDSITVILEPTTSSMALQETEFDLNSQAALSLTSENAQTIQFKPIILAAESQKGTREQLMALFPSLGTRESQIKMASNMLEYARGASRPSLLSAYWLSSQILKTATSENSDFDDFFESSLTLSDEQEVVNQELFSYSLSVLTNDDDYDENPDWRMQAVALEVIADASQRLKENFRTELIDALYPVTQLLGSPNSNLREQAITSLNIISRSCGYKSASELIVQNVDYMVNAVSLRLNTFNISPQAPQVLVMMIRLTGPSLLPYLDDVVGSIFAALDNFHGYQHLVDILFSVLSEIVSVGSTSTLLQVENAPPKSHKKLPQPISTMEDIIALLTPKKNTLEDDSSLQHEDFPRAPWKSAKTLLDEAAPPPLDSDSENEQEEAPPPPQELAPPPPTKTFTLLHRITLLSQHYLTSPSPHLLHLLLTLITTSSPALSTNEDIYLPLINDIYPVLLPLLSTPTPPYVQISALKAFGSFNEYAGDFMSSRISTSWKSFLSLAKKSKLAFEKANPVRKGGRGGGAGRGQFSQESKIWEAWIGFLKNVVEYVGIDDGMFDDVIGVLGGVVWEREDVKEVMETRNGDVVWLAMLRGGVLGEVEKPPGEGWVEI